MAVKNVRMKPTDGPARTHARRSEGNDFTLCGFTLDGDRDVVAWERETSTPVTCEQCWAIITFCRTVKQRKIGQEYKRRGAAPAQTTEGAEQ